MSKKQKKQSRIPVVTHALRPGPNWPLLALAMLGILLTAYLSWASFSGGGVQGCTEGGGCDAVLTSRWATLLGLPTAFWGLLTYAALAAVAFVPRADQHWSYAWTVAFVGVCYSVYLTAVSLTILQTACPYCLTSLALMSASLALVVRQRPPHMAQRSWVGPIVSRGVPAALVILVLHANYVAPQAEPTGPEDPATRALAEHLSDEGAVFYGASWCPHCQEQKRLFGASAERLPYVECSPNGRTAPASPSCSRAGIRSYPTWIIDGKTYVGEVLTLAQLADFTGFKDAKNLK